MFGFDCARVPYITQVGTKVTSGHKGCIFILKATASITAGYIDSQAPNVNVDSLIN